MIRQVLLFSAAILTVALSGAIITPSASACGACGGGGSGQTGPASPSGANGGPAYRPSPFAPYSVGYSQPQLSLSGTTYVRPGASPSATSPSGLRAPTFVPPTPVVPPVPGAQPSLGFGSHVH